MLHTLIRATTYQVLYDSTVSNNSGRPVLNANLMSRLNVLL